MFWAIAIFRSWNESNLFLNFGYCMEIPNIKDSQTRYLHVFWIGNYWKMDQKGNYFESWRLVCEGNIHITATGFEEHCKFWKQILEWITENFLLIHESETHHERLYTTITEIFLRNGYFWNIFYVKTWRREVFSYSISKLARLF